MCFSFYHISGMEKTGVCRGMFPYLKQLFLGLIHCIVTSLVFEMCHILIEFKSCLLDSSCPNKIRQFKIHHFIWFMSYMSNFVFIRLL